MTAIGASLFFANVNNERSGTFLICREMHELRLSDQSN